MRYVVSLCVFLVAGLVIYSSRGGRGESVTLLPREGRLEQNNEPGGPRELESVSVPGSERDAQQATTREVELLLRVGDTLDDLRPYRGDGVLFLRAYGGSHRNLPISLPIRGGRVVLEQEFAGTWSIDHLVLSGRSASPVEYSIHDSPPDRTEMDALWCEPVFLSVISAETGAHLDGVVAKYSHDLSAVSILALRELSMQRDMLSPLNSFSVAGVHEHTPDLRVLPPVVQGESSPIGLDISCGMGSYWVTAPGYEWQSWPTPENHETHRLELRRIGALRVEIEGEGGAFSAGLFVQVSTPEGRKILEWEFDGSQSRRSENLLPGPYVVRLVSKVNENAVLDASAVEVRAGLEAVAVLRMLASGRELAVVQGTLLLENFLGGALSPGIDMWEMGSEVWHALDVRATGTHEYELGPTVLEPGRYSVRLVGWPIAWDVVLEKGENRISLAVLDWRFRTVEVHGAQELEGLSWSMNRSSLDDIMKSESPNDQRAFRVALPEGDVEFLVRTRAQGLFVQQVHIRPEEQVVIIELPERTGLVFSVSDSGTPVPVSFEWLQRVRVYDEVGNELRTSTSWSWMGEGLPTARVWLATPPDGRIRVVPPLLPGFPEVQPATTSVKRGVENEVELIVGKASDL